MGELGCLLRRRCWCLSLFSLPLPSLQLSLHSPKAPALAMNGELRRQKKHCQRSATTEKVVAPASSTPVPMTDPSGVWQEPIIMTRMGTAFLPLEAGIAGTSAVPAATLAVEANQGQRGSLLDLGLLLGLGPLDQGHQGLLGHLEAAKTVTTSAPTVEVARSPMLDLREREGLRVPVSPIALVENAAGLQESARIATGLSTANSRLNINCYDMLHDPMIPKPKDNRFPRPAKKKKKK